MQLLEKNEEALAAFSSLGFAELIDPNVEKAIEKFVCSMYSQSKKVLSVNDARLNQFTKSYKTRKNDLESIKGCDPSTMTPSSATLKQKIKRTNKILSVLKFSHWPGPPNEIPTERSCKMVNINFFALKETPIHLQTVNVVSLQKTKAKNFCTNPPTDGECGIPAEDEGEELLYQSTYRR